MKKEDFKAVDFMRDRRESLSKLHSESPKKYQEQLKKIREKYASKFKTGEKDIA